eukprot:3601420-Pleurochrysis_carterae.AAC.1
MIAVRICVHRLRLGFSVQVREVIVDRCVALGDESYENEQEAAHCQSTWKIASQVHCSCQTLSDGMDAFAGSA